MSESQESKVAMKAQDQEFDLPRLSSLTFNIASGYDPNISGAENITEANRYIVNQLSEAVAKVNRPHFAKKLEPILEKHGDYIKESEIALIDRYGRATYFYCKLGNQIIPLYQPGTIMFESAVKSESKLNVVAHGAQQNGPLLGNGCATFLAKFHCNLIATYQRICAVNELDSSHFYPDKYKQSLKECLKQFGVEDAKEHGRLISMQETLLSLGGTQMQKDDQIIRQFHLKDLSEIHSKPIEEVGADDQFPLSYSEYVEISNMRKKDLYYSESEELFKGKCIADRTLEEYRNGLAQKSGLVPPDQDTMFKLQMQSLITQISEQTKQIKDDMSQHMNIQPMDSAPKGGASKGILAADKKELSSKSKVSYLESLYSDQTEEEVISSAQQEKLEDEWLDKAMKENHRVRNYVTELTVNLTALLSGNTPPHSKEFKYSFYDNTRILQQLGEYAPAIGKVLNIFGFMLGNLEKQIVEPRVANITSLVKNRERLAIQIVKELTIRRRGFIQVVEDKDMRKIVRNFQKMKGQFHLEKLHPEQIVAEIDLRTLYAALVGLDPEKYKKYYEEYDLYNAIEKDICEAFFAPQPFQSISPELGAYEEPISFIRGEAEFTIHPDLFVEFSQHIPKYMKRISGETALEHRQRVEEYIATIGQTQFDKLSMILDPDSPRRKPLFLVYSDALKQRKKIKSGKNKGKCRIL